MEHTERYVYWYEQYMINGVTITTLNKLVKAGKLRQDELDTMVSDRLEQKGY